MSDTSVLYILIDRCNDTQKFHVYACVGERAIIGANAKTLTEALETLVRCSVPDILLAGEAEAFAEAFPARVHDLLSQIAIVGEDTFLGEFE